MKQVLLALLVIFVCVGLSDRSDAARRVALVIGINDYQELPRLEKAVGDARAVAKTLGGLGFEVMTVLDPNRRGLNRAVSRFVRQLAPGDIAFVHYSGHGVEIAGENFLLPRDAPKPASGDVDFVRSESIGMRALLRRVAETGARTRIFVIDACRDNPFERSGVRSVGSTRGLARVEAPAGTFIMYSAGYRQTALDKLGNGDTENTSVYTRVLIEKLRQGGRSISEIAREVRVDVERLAKSVGHVQRPAYYDELSARLVLKAALPPVSQSAAPAAKSTRGQLELVFWNSVKDSRNPAIIESYLKQYPQGAFVTLARTMLDELKEQQIPATGPSLAPPGPEDPIPVTAQTVRAIQLELDRHRCDPGPADGIWGRGSKRAVESFASHASTPLESEPSAKLLETLKQTSEPVCPAVAAVPEDQKPAGQDDVTSAPPVIVCKRARMNSCLRARKLCARGSLSGCTLRCRQGDGRACATAKRIRADQRKKASVNRKTRQQSRRQTTRQRRSRSGISGECGICRNIRVCGHRLLQARGAGLCD